MTETILRGIPVWHELVTRDTDKCKAFYTALFGWGVQSWPMGEGASYEMFAVGERPICGIDVEHGQVGGPAFWVTHFSVADVDAALAANAAAGGKTLQAGVDVPEVGRVSACRDPQGAMWCPFKGLKDPVLPDFSAIQPGDFVWEELLTSDPVAACEHYGKLLGYEVEETSMGEMGTYRLLKVAGSGLAGVMAMPPEAESPPHWLPYIFMPDVDAAAAKAVELGGCVYVQPMDIPGVGRFSVLADSLGASIAVFCSSKD